MYLLRSIIDMPPNLFGRSVDVFWGDVFGSLSLNNSQALAKLIEKRHLGFFFLCLEVEYGNGNLFLHATMFCGGLKERRKDDALGCRSLRTTMFWVATPKDRVRATRDIDK